MGKVPKNGFCYILVNTILKMTSQYNAYWTIFFRHFPCCSCTETVCIAVCYKFR